MERAHGSRVVVAMIAVAIAAESSLGAQPETPRHRPKVVLCLGDSLTEGYGVEAAHSYPSVLERRLRDRSEVQVRVINAGINGSTSASAVSRLRWQLKARPDLMILALGANDGLRGLDLAETERNLAAAIEVAQNAGVEVVLAGMQIPPNYGAAYTARFQGMFTVLSKRYSLALIPFLLEGVAAKPELNLPDGIHPNSAGYERVVDNVLEVLEPLL